MTTAHKLPKPRYYGYIKTVNTTPPSAIIISEDGGAEIISTDFAPAQLACLLTYLSQDMRYVSFSMTPYLRGWRAEEVLCEGELPADLDNKVVKLVDAPTWAVTKRKSKSTLTKEKSYIGPTLPVRSAKYTNIHGQRVKTVQLHDVLRTQRDQAMGDKLVFAVRRGHDRASRRVAVAVGTGALQSQPRKNATDELKMATPAACGHSQAGGTTSASGEQGPASKETHRSKFLKRQRDYEEREP